MDNCIAKLDWTPRFDEPLLPGTSTDLELQWQTLAVLAIQNFDQDESRSCDANKINELIGTHKISKVKAIVSSYQFDDPDRRNQEITRDIGPSSSDKTKRFNAKETLDNCASVIALMEDNNFAEEDIDNHSICFNNIGLASRQKTFQEKLSEDRK